MQQIRVSTPGTKVLVKVGFPELCGSDVGGRTY